MLKSSFLIAGKHPVIEALKNPRRKVLRVFLTEESKKNLNKENQNNNLLKGIKIFYKNDLKPPSLGLLSPSEVLNLNPKPIFVQYQWFGTGPI